MTYPQDYSFNIAPTDRREDMIKASSAEYLDEYNRNQIDKGIKFIREMKQDGESKYLKLDVDLCIGAVRDANVSRAAHKALPAPEGKRPSKAEGLAAIARMRASVDFERVEPLAPDTARAEADLLDRKIIERGERQ